MKRLHRPDLFAWSRFSEQHDIDFHSFVWVRPGGNVIIDPLPLSSHDREHLERLGQTSWIVITNSDHIRDAGAVAQATGARILGPRAERSRFPVACERWIGEGDEVVPGLKGLEVAGSKTPGEIALLLEETTLIVGDLIRAHEGGSLCLLPDAKLSDRDAAVASLKTLADLPRLQTVLTGDGWPVFRDARTVLQELVARLISTS